MSTTLVQRLKNARAVSGEYYQPILDLTRELTAISSPTFQEADRAKRVADVLADAGLDAVMLDDISNVTARIPGKDRSKAVLVAAHTDTVFPHGTDLTITEQNGKLHAPGIGDNTIAVAAVAHLKAAFERLGEQPAIDLILTGNVGEEGLGDLRGMRAVMDANPDIVGAIAVEGMALGSVTYEAVGSKRYKVTVKGPGGHSWIDAGQPSAIQHLCDLIAQMGQIELSDNPKTTFNAGIFHGGVSVNTIAPEAHAVLDMRSTSAESLGDLVKQIDEIIAGPKPDGISVACETVGDRPAGAQPIESPLVQIARHVLLELGIDPKSRPGSTDANVPIARGIPAICIGLTTGSNAHREDEYIDLAPVADGFAHLITVILEAAEMLATE